MDDLISRKAVMASLTKEYNRRFKEGGLKLAWIEKAVNETPSAQPETHEKRTETHACDCISRQVDDTISREAAIETLDNRFKQHLLENRFESFEEADSETKQFCDGIMESMGVVMDLPSAQQIIRCKDCKHSVDYYHDGDCYCSNPKWGLKYFGGSWEFYCADAERGNR